MPDVDVLPEIELENAFDRLVTVFGESPKQRRAGWIWALREKTRNWTAFELRVATKEAASSCRFFPRPKDILDRRPQREPATPDEASPVRDVCRDCRQHRYYAGFRMPDGTIHPRLRCDCPQPGAGWDHPEALAWKETSEDLVAAGYSRHPDVLRFPR